MCDIVCTYVNFFIVIWDRQQTNAHEIVTLEVIIFAFLNTTVQMTSLESDQKCLIVSIDAPCILVLTKLLIQVCALFRKSSLVHSVSLELLDSRAAVRCVASEQLE